MNLIHQKIKFSDLATAAIKFLKGADLTRRLGQAVGQRVLNNYTCKEIINKFLGIIK